nr:MAG TPA: hypothetical protein [Caudoviricetes sp.]
MLLPCSMLRSLAYLVTECFYSVCLFLQVV